MTQEKCASCDRTGSNRQQIEHEQTGEQINLCWECLRSQLRAKAAASDDRARQLLSQDAERFGWQVWSSEDVLYLLPSLNTPKSDPAGDEAETIVDVTHG